MRRSRRRRRRRRRNVKSKKSNVPLFLLMVKVHIITGLFVYYPPCLRRVISEMTKRGRQSEIEKIL